MLLILVTSIPNHLSSRQQLLHTVKVSQPVIRNLTTADRCHKIFPPKSPVVVSTPDSHGNLMFDLKVNVSLVSPLVIWYLKTAGRYHVNYYPSCCQFPILTVHTLLVFYALSAHWWFPWSTDLGWLQSLDWFCWLFVKCKWVRRVWVSTGSPKEASRNIGPFY